MEKRYREEQGDKEERDERDEKEKKERRKKKTARRKRERRERDRKETEPWMHVPRRALRGINVTSRYQSIVRIGTG